MKFFSKENLKKAVGLIAPTIGGSLGGPFGAAAAKMAVNALTGSEPSEGENPLEALSVAMSGASPEQLATLKNADYEFETAMAELGIRKEELHAGDRDSARNMAIQKGMVPQIIMSVIYTVAYGIVLYCFMAGKIAVPESQQILFGSLIGILTAAQVQILNFWFGSSSGSKEKTNKK